MSKEFPEGKENYCPRCYFEDDLTVLRVNCKHSKPAQKCDCKNRYCEHYESDFDRFVKENPL